MTVEAQPSGFCVTSQSVKRTMAHPYLVKASARWFMRRSCQSILRL